MTVDPAPVIGRAAQLHLEITSEQAAPNTTIQVTLSPGMDLVSGELKWEGSIDANQTKEFDLTIRVKQAGEWPVSASAFAADEPGSEFGFGAGDTLYLLSSYNAAEVIPKDKREKTPIPALQGWPDELPQPEMEAFTTRAPAAGVGPGPAPVGGTVTLSGVLRYEARGQFSSTVSPRPLGRARVELWDLEEDGSIRNLTTTPEYTSQNGGYSISAPNTDPDGSGVDPFLLVYATDDAHIEVLTASGFVYFFVAMYPLQDLQDGSYSFDFTMPQTLDLEPLFIFDMIRNVGHQELAQEVGWDNLDKLTVRWPKQCVEFFAGSCYYFGTVYLLEDDGWDPDVILHEYSHFVMSDSYGNPRIFSACIKLPVPFIHMFDENTTQTCAWSEGWADFLEAAIQKEANYVDTFEDVSGNVVVSLNLNLESPTGLTSPPLSLPFQNVEGAVTASLWDIYDSLQDTGSVDESFDVLTNGLNGPMDNGIWALTHGDTPSQIEDFWSSWNASTNGQHCEVSAILREYQIPLGPASYRLTTVADPAQGSIGVDPQGNCPEDKYEDGTAVTVTAVSLTGYVFTHWTGDATGNTNPLDIVMNSDKTITAHFAVPTPTPSSTPTPTLTLSPTVTPTRTPSPPPTFPRMPICGDQDGSETPLIFRCPNLLWAGDVQLYQVPGSGPVELTFDFILRDAAYNNELAFFLVDDALGRIAGIAPGEPGYVAAALARSQVIFPSGSNAFTPDVSVQLEGGRFIVVFIVQNSRLSVLLTNNPNNELNKRPLAFFSFNPLNPDGVDHFIGYENLALDISHFGFEDLTGGGDRDFDDIAYNVIPRLQPLTARVYLSPLSAEKTVGEAHTLSAEVLDKQGSPLSGELVTFEVEGANPTVGSASTNGSGIATFSYVGSHDGDDTVIARTSEAVSNIAIVLWRSSCPIRVFFGGGSSAAGSTGTTGRAMLLIRRLQQTVDVVRLLERVRDEVLTTTPQGQRYVELFNLHASEITALMLADEALRDQGIATVEAFVPALQAFVDGEGGQVVVTSDQVNSVIAFLQALSGVASPELTHDIEAELARRPLGPIAGMTMDEAWGYLNNLPPVAEAGGPYEIDEGQSVVLDASGSTDPDNNIVLYEWDLDSDGEFDDAAGVTATVAFGDNGTFTVGVKVTDELGESSSDTAEITVSNLPPEVALDTSAAIPFVGGDAFLGRAGITQSHSATATDAGSDDLTFTWAFGPTMTYFNNGSDADPFTSPDGTFPFTAVHTASATFDSPGKYELDLTVVDDDRGSSSVAFTKLVTGAEACTFSQGFWKHQFSGQGNQQVDNDTLQAYLAIVNYASGLFSEAMPLNTLAEASTVMDAKGSGMRPKAQAQLLAAWLNFAHGSVGWDEAVDTDGDRIGDMAFSEVVAQAEAILINPNASQQELVRAKDLAEAVNLLDQGTEGCE